MRLFRLLAPFAVLLLVAAACGSNNNKSSNNKPAGNASGSAASAAAGTAAPAAGGKVIHLTMHYPVGVAGPLATIINNYVAEFHQQNPDIDVTPVYDGDYATTLAKCLQLVQAGTPPDTAILNAAAIYTLTDANAVMQLDDLIKQSGGDSFINDFFPAFLANSQLGGHTWSIPYQRSTMVMYYNKDAFKEAGLDPEKPPQTWDELVDDAQKLTKRDASGNVVRWGVGYGSDGAAYWEFQALPITFGKNVVDPDKGNVVYFNTPEAVKGLQLLYDFGRKYKVSPEGTVGWSTIPAEFDAGKYAIVFHSTGSLTAILKGANFPVGVAFIPKGVQYGSQTGGGNLYIFKGIPQDHVQAAWKFIQWMTSTERQAKWSIDTGYVAARKSSWDTQTMKEYIAKVPQVTVARDQLQYAQTELGTHQMAQVQQILSDAIGAALTGQDSVQGALDKAQQKAMDILKQYKN